MTRNKHQQPVKAATVPEAQGAKRRGLAAAAAQQLDGDACREAKSFLVHCPDEAGVFQKMKVTFQHRQELEPEPPQKSTDVFKMFQRTAEFSTFSHQV